MVDIEMVANFHIRALERVGIVQSAYYGEIISDNFQISDCRYCPMFRLTQEDAGGFPSEGVCALKRVLIQQFSDLPECEHLETAMAVNRLYYTIEGLDSEIDHLIEERDHRLVTMKKMEESYDRFDGISCW